MKSDMVPTEAAVFHPPFSGAAAMIVRHAPLAARPLRD
jgi:hypothetical protein